MAFISNFIDKYKDNKSTCFVISLMSFLESFVSPIPPDILLIPASIVSKKKSFQYAFWCTLCSLIGGIIGYMIGLYLFDTLGSYIIKTYGYEDAFRKFCGTFQNWAFVAIALKGFTPIPYKLVTIASGLAGIDFFTFFSASIIARGGRFFVLAYICNKLGDKAYNFIKNNATLFSVIVLVIVILGFWIVLFV